MCTSTVDFKSDEFAEFEKEMVQILMISGFEVEYVIEKYEEFKQGIWKPQLK